MHIIKLTNTIVLCQKGAKFYHTLNVSLKNEKKPVLSFIKQKLRSTSVGKTARPLATDK